MQSHTYPRPTDVPTIHYQPPADVYQQSTDMGDLQSVHVMTPAQSANKPRLRYKPIALAIRIYIVEHGYMSPYLPPPIW